MMMHGWHTFRFSSIPSSKKSLPRTSTTLLSILYRCGFTTTSFTSKPQATWDEEKCKSFMTPSALARRPSAIRALLPYMNQPGMLSLAGGLPDPDLFPVRDVQIKWNNEPSRQQEGEKEIKKWLQYGPTKGHPDFLKRLETLQETYHGTHLPMCVSNGSQDLLSKVMTMLVSPGERVLVESPSYPGIVAMLKPLGIQCLGLPMMDDEGLSLDSLHAWMENQPSHSCLPRVLYTIPTAHNPTGITTSLKRRQAILKVAEKHDLIIVEDDPYFYLQASPYVPSYLSLAPYGRVIRLDSMSKVLSAGIRIGWVTTMAPFLKVLEYDMQATCLQPNGLGQFLCAQYPWNSFPLLCESIHQKYQEKLLFILKFLHVECTDYVTFHPPKSGGMFLWLKINGIDAHLFSTRCLAHGVVVVPGYAFYFTPPTFCDYIRISFSTLSNEDLKLALQRLKQCIIETRKELGLPT
ncbi:hypothetical protein HMI54_001480 [Coelomomyces lativittatus]|nr:hypothetical protein HMI55_002289 [Coelomomyces lativittatus]KAJ1508183.1 hypothetical protein HMI56_007411 [Coelomomyces lativittatus]KAJ1510558.1 hypothetical protein HMI54_001480 [Coelomomyces lativittatus]